MRAIIAVLILTALAGCTGDASNEPQLATMRVQGIQYEANCTTAACTIVTVIVQNQIDHPGSTIPNWWNAQAQSGRVENLDAHCEPNQIPAYGETTCTMQIESGKGRISTIRGGFMCSGTPPFPNQCKGNGDLSADV